MENSAKKRTIEKLKVELEEDLYSIARSTINSDPFNEEEEKLLVFNTVIEYCKVYAVRLQNQRLKSGITTEEIQTLVLEVYTKIRHSVEKHYGDQLEEDVNTHETSLKNIPEQVVEEDYSGRHYNVHQEDSYMNEWFYKFCYSTEIYDFFLIYEKNPNVNKSICRIEWFKNVDSVTYLQLKNYLFKNLVEVEKEKIGSSEWLIYNGVPYKFSTYQHFFEDNSFFEYLCLDINEIDSLEYLDYPIVKAFIVFVKDDIVNSLFSIQYEPIPTYFTLNKITKTNVSKLIEIGDGVEELLDDLFDKYTQNRNSLFLNN